MQQIGGDPGGVVVTPIHKCSFTILQKRAVEAAPIGSPRCGTFGPFNLSREGVSDGD
jgi:hypothetical protein